MKHSRIIRRRFLAILMMAMVLSLVSCSSDQSESVVPEPKRPALSKAVLNISVQDNEMPETSNATRATEVNTLRAVFEVYKVGGQNLLLSHQEAFLTATSDGYTCELDALPEGECDIYVWLDYGYYQTQSLRAIGFGESYTSDENSRKAFYGSLRLNVSEQTVAQGAIEAKSPFARYRIEALDVEEYERIKHVNNWPELSDVEVRVTYESYFPCSFNAITGKPNDARRGLSYTSSVSLSDDGKSVIASDYVLVNGSESTISIRIEIINRQTGEVISSVSDVDVTYRRGYETVVSGNILTAGTMDGNVYIDTRWEGEYNVNF